jgi:hypothetical protein
MTAESTKTGYLAIDRYDQRHGGPFDRGSADSYYHREYNPHYFVGATGSSTKITMAEMSAEDIVAYTAGYNWNEQYGSKKDYE